MTRTRGASGGGVGSSREGNTENEDEVFEAAVSLKLFWNGLRMDFSEDDVDILISK